MRIDYSAVASMLEKPQSIWCPDVRGRHVICTFRYYSC